MIELELEQGLDHLAQLLFTSAPGATHMARARERWLAEVGELRADDPDIDRWAESRADWALCDVPALKGDPWCVRMAQDSGPEAAVARRLASTFVGLFELWPGPRPWLRDRLGGVCLRLAHPVDLLPAARGPAALWEMRVAVEGGYARPARRPLTYPLDLVSLWPAHAIPRPECRGPVLARLRRARLRWARYPRHDMRRLFADIVRG